MGATSYGVWGGGLSSFLNFKKKKKIDIGLTLFAFILQNLCRHALMMLPTSKVLLRFPFGVGGGMRYGLLDLLFRFHYKTGRVE